MKYYVITDGQIEVLMAKIKHSILRELKPLNLPQLDEALSRVGSKSKVVRKRGDRPRLADVIFSVMKKDVFSAAEVYEQVKEKYTFKGNRGIDAIRTAMLHDSVRFRKLEDGNYARVKREAVE